MSIIQLIFSIQEILQYFPEIPKKRFLGTIRIAISKSLKQITLFYCRERKNMKKLYFPFVKILVEFLSKLILTREE